MRPRLFLISLGVTVLYVASSTSSGMPYVDGGPTTFDGMVFYASVGGLYRYRGNFPEAENWYRKAIDKAPDQASGYIFLGAVQARQGKLKEAEESHRRATQCTEGHIDEAHHNLGLVLRGQGRLADAAACFRKAIELTPDYADVVEALQDVESALLFGA
jgi:tetratricopeptide (TPR) repeat protein